MKTNLIKSIIIILVTILSYQNVFSQEKKIYKGEVPAPVKIENNVLLEQQEQPSASSEALDFQNRLKTAKESGNREEILRLQKESDRITGTHTAVPQQLPVNKLSPEEAGENQDNIVMNNIANSSERIINAMATCTEQTGSTMGRIWSVYTYYKRGAPYYPAGIGIKYSDDNGITWIYFGIYSFGGSQLVGSDWQADAELVINSFNEKYLWITFATDITAYTQIGLFIVNLNTGTVTNSVLNWPSGPYVNYKTPRIVSDNSYYTNSAYMYIVASFDSADTQTSGMAQGEKVAICFYPYTTSPSITYKPSSFMRTVNIGQHNWGVDYFNCDIGYYRNGGQDSILLVETGLASNSSITLGRASIFSYVSTSPILAYAGTININSNKRARGFVASNGAYNNLMISVINEYSLNDHDVEYYRSTNGSKGWSQGFIDFTGIDAKGDAEIAGQINNPGKFVVAFTNHNPNTIRYYQSDSYNWNFVSLNSFNHMMFVTLPSPKAGIRLNSGSENCFALWGDSTMHGLWSSAGCTGPVQIYAKLNRSVAIEGLHDPQSNTLIPDTVKVYLRNSFAPYNIVDSSVNVLGNILLNEFIFNNITYNTPYYIQIRHRNALESWSSGTIAFSSYEKTYSFWPQANTFGGNSNKIFDNGIITIYGFYSGDVDQDGAIDLNDVLSVYNAAGSFSAGYVVNDVNGDNIVDLNDILITYNNSVGFVSVRKP